MHRLVEEPESKGCMITAHIHAGGQLQGQAGINVGFHMHALAVVVYRAGSLLLHMWLT